MSIPSEATSDYDLQEAWARVCQSFAKTTKVDLTAAPQYSVDEVLEQIRTRQEEDNEKGAKYREVKEFIKKTITFISVLGGIVAQGASMVFAPSSLCFNALSYLISTGAKYKKIFTGLSELFRKICDVLDRLKIYMELSKESVHISLRKIINDQLLCFVDICALSIKVLQGHRVLLALKVFAFSGDEGVSGQLARLQMLVERESEMRATLGFASQKASEQRIVESLERTKTIDSAVNKLLDAERKRDAYVQASQTLDELDIALDKPSEEWARTQAEFKSITGQRIPGTGEWISEHPLYKSWAMLEKESFSILGIKGNEGCGKSFLVASIIQDLKGMHLRKEGITIPSLAYYSFDQRSEGFSLAQALKVLAWQFANSSLVYCKDLSTIAMSTGNDNKLLWDALFAKSYQSDLCFFMLLDGLQHLTSNETQDLMGILIDLTKTSSQWGKFKLHILLSDSIGDIASQLQVFCTSNASVIIVAEHNGGDLQKFIEHRFGRMESLRGSSEEVIAIRSEVLDNLKTYTKGDFVATGLLLDEISKKQRPSEIRGILTHSGSNREEIISKKIQQLNTTLSENDINDLNEILKWLVFAAEPLTLAYLEEVLFLKNGERSLKPLAKSILDQYSSLICVEGKPKTPGAEFPLDSRVLLVSDSIKDMLIGRKTDKAKEGARDESEVKTVNESEIRIVRRFLESVCDASLFDRFGFENFFDEKLEKQSVKLFVDKERAHFEILKMCLEIICSPVEKNVLRGYAIKFFPHHLEHLDLSLIHPIDKTALGPNLVALFYDARVIRQWWEYEWWWSGDGCIEQKQSKAWFYQDKYTDLVMKWLQDSAVTRDVGDEQIRWVRSVISNSEPDADILERITQLKAENWLQSSLGKSCRSDFPLVYGCFMKIEHRKDPTKQRPIRDPDDDEVELSQILATAGWAARKFNGRDSLSPEDIYSVGMTLAAYGKQEESIDQLKIASSLMSDNCDVEWELAKVYAAQKEHARAIQLIEGVIGRAKAKGKASIEFMKNDLATWYDESGHYEEALEIYQALLEDFPTYYGPVCNILGIFSRSKDVGSILRLLQSLKSSSDEWIGFDRQTTSFVRHYGSDEFHEILLAMGSEGPLLDVVRTAYEAAIAAAEAKYIEAIAGTDDDPGYGENAVWDQESKVVYALTRKVSLMSYHAAHRYYSPAANMQDRRHAIEEWESILSTDVGAKGNTAGVEMEFNWVLVRTREHLTKAYLAEAQRDPERSASYLDKLEQFARVNVSKDLTSGLKREVAHLLAQYYAIHGDTDKAKSVLRPYLKVDLDILCDDDPLNDWEGYLCLSTHFWAVGAKDALVAAWSLITPHPEYSNSDKLKGPLDVRCDGGCETGWTYADNFYLCATCKDRQYDQDCLDQLRSGALEADGCDKEHEMIHIPAYDPATVGAGNVRMGGEIMSVHSWIQLIREDWGLEG